MTLNIEFPPQISARLSAFARQQGIDPVAAVEKLVTEHLPPVQADMSQADEENQALINLLRSWREEDRTDDVQELERRDAETNDLMANLQANRLSLRRSEV